MRKNNSISYSEFEQICLKIKNLLVKYFNEQDKGMYYQNENDGRKTDLSKTSMLLFLSNGDKLNFNIPKSSVAHLLGINTNYLISTGLFSRTDSYSIMLEFINNPYNFYQKHNEGHINLNIALSDFVEEKLAAFEKNTQVDIGNSEFVCKYKKERSYGYNDDFDADYLILTRCGENYYAMTIQENENPKTGEKYYASKSNLFYETYDEALNALSSKLYNQELTIINCKSVRYGYGESKKIYLSAKDRKNKIQILGKWSRMLDCIPNMLNDLYHFVETTETRINTRFENIETIKEVIELVKNRKIINFDINDLPWEIQELLKAYNDSLYNIDGKEDIKISEILEKNKELEERLLKLEEENALLKKQGEKDKKRYVDLQEKNTDLEETINVIKKALGCA